MVWLTGILVIITGVYAYLTFRMTRASERSVGLMKHQVDSLTRPYVTVSIVKPPNDISLLLKIENTGRTPAHDLQLRFGSEFSKLEHLDGMNQIRSSYLFTQTMTSFPPNSPVLFFLGFGGSYRGEDEKKYPQDRFSIIAKYTYSDQQVEETTWLDINQYNASVLETDPLVNSIKKLEETVRKKK